jgi:F0F1-type ATP synthase assembly protein I
MAKTTKSGKEDNEEINYSIIRQLAPYMNLGWQLVISVGVMALLGWWLDGKFHTKPWLLVAGSLLGAAAGLYTFIKTVIDLSNKKTKNENNKKLS